MNFRLVANITSYVLWVEAGFLLLPLAVSVFSGEAWLPFFITAVLCILIGGALHLVPVKNRKMHGRDGFMAVALSWIALSLMGALPYVLTGALDSYVDAVFETVSGLTTTGSTVFPEVEHLPYSVLLWRSLTQWMGGMGVLVLFLALMPKLGDGAVYLMRAESPGPIKSKLVPKVGSTAKILYCIYVALTVLEMACLRIAGLSWFSAVNHAFTTMATGGFSINNTSLAGSSPAVMWIITVFSFLAGVNFSLLFLAATGKLRTALRSEELRVYTTIVVSVTLLICVCLRVQAGVHRRLRRLHLRRYEAVPCADPLEIAGPRAKAHGPSQPRQRHHCGRSARGGACRLVYRRVYHGLYGGAVDRCAGGELG